ncbi:hypothetical protein HII13_004160 [Brettanomyces bruxellensis]|nr:hypothetical protein HII13_004160 [Brettanomyces bruxellensis]
MISSASQGHSSSRESLPLKKAHPVQAAESRGGPVSPEKKNGSDTSLPLPKTPSMNRNATFETAGFPMFQTPEKTPIRQISRDDQSRGRRCGLRDAPIATRSGVSGVEKTQKTPQHSRPVSIEEGEIRRLEECSWQSPEKEYSVSPRVERGTDVKRISENLKTQLNYAKAKIQHGWSDKSLAEVRKQLETQKEGNKKATKRAGKSDKTSYDEFWKTPEAGSSEQAENATKIEHFAKSHGIQHSITLDEVASHHRKLKQYGASGSAERALLVALSPRTPRHAPPNGLPPPVSRSPIPETRLEHDAIVSLMTLATPKDKLSASSSPQKGQKGHLSAFSPGLLHRRSPNRDANARHHPSKTRTFARSPAYDDDDITEVETSDEDESRVRLPALDSRLSSSPISRTLPPLQVSPRFAGTGQLVGLGLSKNPATFASLRTRPSVGRFGEEGEKVGGSEKMGEGEKFGKRGNVGKKRERREKENDEDDDDDRTLSE